MSIRTLSERVEIVTALEERDNPSVTYSISEVTSSPRELAERGGGQLVEPTQIGRVRL